MKITEICELELGKLIYKIHNGLFPTAVKEEFIASTSVHNHNKRPQKKENYYLPRSKTSYGQKTLGFRCTKFWTNVDPALKNATWHTVR